MMKIREAVIPIELTPEEAEWLVSILNDLPWDFDSDQPGKTIMKKLTTED